MLFRQAVLACLRLPEQVSPALQASAHQRAGRAGADAAWQVFQAVHRGQLQEGPAGETASCLHACLHAP